MNETAENNRVCPMLARNETHLITSRSLLLSFGSFAAFRNTALIRPCQPRPLLRKCASRARVQHAHPTRGG